MKLEDIILNESYSSIIDNRDGLGQVAINDDIDYFGIRVLMSPSKFLKLAAPGAERDSTDHIKDHLESGGKIASPFLDLHLPTEWTEEILPERKGDDRVFPDMPYVKGHDGRNRMLAILELYRDVPIEVHIVATPLRNRHFYSNPGWIQEIMRNGILSEQSRRIITNPITKVLR